MDKKRAKYIATQVSGPIFAFLIIFLLLVIVKNFYSSLLVEMGVTKILVFLFSFLVLLLGSMVLWGRILVLFGVLTKDEAKRYPWSKPWKKDDE